MAIAQTSADEWTYPPRKWTLLDTTSDVDLAATLGHIARALRADTAGTVVFRSADDEAAAPDTTMSLAAGESLLGFITHVKSTSTATIHAAK